MPTPEQDQMPANECELARDFKLAYHLIRHYKLATIPPTAFYSTEHQSLGTDYLRFCFCKTEPLLQEAFQCLERLGADISARNAQQ
jgi:aspartate/methionine/tyrosine aminotransferase